MALTTNLAAFWDFNADDADDQHTGGIDWVENGTITYEAGTPGRAVTIGAGSANHLSITDANSAGLEIGTNDMTYCFRFKSNTLPASFNTLYTKGGTANEAGITITHKSNGEFFIRLANGTSNIGLTYNEATLSAGTEGFFYVRLDRDGNMDAGLDDNAIEDTSISSFSSDDIQSSDSARIATGFQNNGDFTISLCAIWTRYLSDTEIQHVKNGTEGITYESELQRDGWDPTSNCARWKITAKAAEIGGTGTQTAHDLVIDSNSLPDTLKDSDSTYHITSGNVRASLDSAGAKQIPLHVIEASPNATPASADYEIRVLPEDHFGGDNTLDGTNGTDIYLWCGLSGATVSPVAGLYGSQSVYEDNIPLALTGQDSTDATRNGNDGTDSLMQTNVTNTPYGVEARDFDSGVTSRIVIDHDPSLSATDNLTTEHWFYCTSDTGTFQGLMSKRRSTIANFSQALQVGGNVSAKFTVGGTFYGLDVSWNTYFALNTWYHIIAEWETSGSDTICRIFQDGTQIGTTTVSGQNLASNSEDITIGAIQTSSIVWAFPFDGHQKGHIIRKALWSDDQKTTRFNNQSGTSDFWDTTAAVEEPSSGITETVTEGADAGDTFTGEHTARVTISEGARAGETIDVSITSLQSISEGGLAGDTFQGIIATGELITEGAAAGESIAAILTLSPVTTEGASAGDTFIGTVISVGSISEAISEGGFAGDTMTSLYTTLGAISEGALAGDTFSASTTYRVTWTEGASAGDSFFLPSGAAYATGTLTIFNATNATTKINP